MHLGTGAFATDEECCRAPKMEPRYYRAGESAHSGCNGSGIAVHRLCANPSTGVTRSQETPPS